MKRPMLSIHPLHSFNLPVYGDVKSMLKPFIENFLEKG